MNKKGVSEMSAKKAKKVVAKAKQEAAVVKRELLWSLDDDAREVK